ncbi:neuraminidase-like domain-containing protein [uncultured Desulfobacter sp.]|uniref:Tc toxin subunit A-related protein n=1 Tax=uncultured Desulfobacter sp. TaxID=240139 RepID=UPI002AABCCC6|nr:neuraminidase-like domain-containing protein [uncultured Desulfobacter sp.]
MDKITFPLKKGDKGACVANLQDALRVMLDQKAIVPVNARQLLVWKTGLASERSEQTYGAATSGIVKKFQTGHNFNPDSIVGSQTAEAMNKFLTEWGLLEQATEPETPAYKLQGLIKQADGSPVVDILVRAFDKDLRHEQQLGDARTDRRGYYKIGYSQSQFRRAEKQLADLVVRVYGAEENLLAESGIIFNAQKDEIVDLILQKTEPEASEYERLMAEISPLLDGVKIDQLTPDDIIFLREETGLESTLIADLVSAAKLAVTTRLSESAHYGLIREDLPGELSALIRQDPQAQRRALVSAGKNNRIPELSEEEQNKILDRLNDLLIESLLEDPEKSTQPILGRLLASTLVPLSPRQKKAFVKLHVEAGTKNDLWENLKQHPEFQQAGLVDELKTTIQIGNLTQNHAPLIRSVQKMRQKKDINKVGELARLTIGEWGNLIKHSTKEHESVVPPTITGETDAEKIDTYARQISEQLENLFPTLSIAYRVEQDDLPGKENLSVFLKRSIIDREGLNADIPEFDFATTHIDQYLEAYADMLLEKNMDRDALSRQLKSIQRLFRITPSYDKQRLFLQNGLHSAQSMVRMGARQFVNKFSEQLGGEKKAVEMYDKAEFQNAMATALLIGYSPAFHGVTPTVVPAAPQPSEKDLATIPDWPSLFGSLDFCACKHCQSVYSPAAYLVDVLHFLKAACPAKTGNKSAKDVLFQRRPDIGEIELSCSNTNTPVPYIDLVNEILEHTVSPSNVVPQTHDSAEEISANPEYLNPEAYNTLRKAIFPWSLPFDLWAEECRVFLQQLGTKRYEIKEVFSDKPRKESLIDGGIAREYLGLNPLEGNIITGFDHLNPPVQVHRAWEYWGYPKSPEPAGWPKKILNIPIFLQKSGLNHAELLELLNTRIVNPDPAHRILDISPKDACQLDEMTLTPKSDFSDDKLEAKLNVIHRFIRLQRKLGWTMLELDQAFTTFGIEAPTSVFLVQLSHIERLRKSLKLPIVNLLSFWSNIDTVNYEGKEQQILPSLYDKLFRNKTLLGGNKDCLKAFALDSSLTISATIGDYGSVLMAVLGIGQDDLNLLINALGLNPSGELNLARLSALYRNCLLTKTLKLKISELFALKTLTNTDPFDVKHTENLLLFAETLQRIHETGFSVKELNYLYRHNDDSTKPVAPAAQDFIKLSQTLLNEFARINEGTRINPASEEQFKTLLASLLDENQLNAAFEFLNGDESLLDTADNRETLGHYFGFFLPEIPNYSKLLTGQKEDAITSLSNFLTPFLRDQQYRTTVKQTLSETLNIDKLMTESLLDKHLRSQRDPNALGLSAIDDFLDLHNAGLLASYKGKDSQGNVVIVTQIDPCLDFDWGNAAQAEGIVPGTLQQVAWDGKVLAPSSETYTFHLDAAGTAELVIDVGGNNPITVTPQSSQPISFTAGDIYIIKLTYTPSDTDTQRIQLSWSSPSTAQTVIPQSCLYPDDSFSRLTRTYTLLWKAALLISRFTLTVKEVDYLSQHGADFADFNLNDLPLTSLSSGQIDTKFFKQWERLYALSRLRDSLPVNEADLTDVFALASTPDKAREKLAEATGWDMDKLPDLTEEDLKNEIRLFKLHNQLMFSYRMGIALSGLKNWCQCPLNDEDAQKQAQAIKNGLKSSYENTQWLEVAKPLKNTIREQQRSALVAYLLANPQVMNLTSLKDSDDLYDQLLIDVEMGACQMTSRIKQANSSIQLFVQRCLMGLESDVYLDKSAANQWKWMKNYRVWEANRKVFLYPENWIEPELRDDKSPFFKEMENDLLQAEINSENVETAFRNYLEKLDDVALLDVRGMYWQLEDSVNILHVFARTMGGAPFTYYSRQWVKSAYWTPWEKVNVDIQGDHLVPVIYNRRLRLYWPIFEEKPEENNDPPSDLPQKLHWEIKLAWSEYKNGKWSTKKISNGCIKSCDREEFDHRSNYTKDQYFFLPLHRPNRDMLSLLCFEKPTQEQFKNISMSPKLWNDNYPYYKFTVKFIGNTSVGGFDIIGCHDTISYCDLIKWFSGQEFYFYCNDANTKFSDLKITDDDFEITTGVRTNPLSASTWHTLHEVMWWYYHALPELPKRSVYINEALVEDCSNKSNDKLGFKIYYDLMLATPGQFNLCFPNQYGSLEFNIDVKLSQEYDPYNPITRQMYLPFFYQDNTRNFFVTSASQIEFDTKVVKKKWHNFFHPYTCRFISELNRNGIDGILAPPDQGSDMNRQFCHNIFFKDQYIPLKAEKPYPIEWIDFMPDGSYSLYNWELFFHAPLLIADRLMDEQRFEEAQKWLHYIFDPTIDDDPVNMPLLFQKIQKVLEDILGVTGIDYQTDTTARRYWKIQPFFLNCLDQISIQQLMMHMAKAKNWNEKNPARQLLETMVEQWREDPFKPHLIARLRISAYQKNVVMKYLNNLIAWADNLFRRDTMESINEATQLYILAAKILGPRPTEIQSRTSRPVKTYNDLEPHLDAFSNALVEIENHLVSPLPSMDNNLPFFQKKKMLLPEFQDSGWPSVSATLSNPSLYFCIPHNEEMLAYWDTISDRLFKVRHCMNIEGMVRQLPLFEPPINPALLVKAAAAGLDIGSVLQDLYAPMPTYRFQVILQKAVEFCGEVKSLGAALLSALEKKDAEALSLLRTNNEVDLLKTATQIKEKQIEEAEESIAVLIESKALATARKQHYENISTRLPEESHYLEKQAESIAWQILSQEAAYLGSSAATPVPEIITAGRAPSAAGVDTKILSGEKIAAIANLVSMYLGWLGQINSLEGTEASYKAGLTRAQQDRDLRIKLAAKEIQQIEKQENAAKIRKEIVEKELDHHNEQIEKAEAVQTAMQEKFTNKELYSWMSSQISGIYFQSYKLAYDLAKQAERAFRFELGLDESNYIQFGYWDSRNKGLLAAEKLALDLKRIETAYLEKNCREYELTKNISLVLHDPMSLIQLKESGVCEILLPEELFDADYPGHYFRRIKNVSLTMPCVVGPYTGINCTLSLLSSRIRAKATITDNYSETLESADSRFRYDFASVKSIATSHGQNDNGMFDLNFRDERYLPFEGAGVISRWCIELPEENNAFNLSTLSDVVLRLNYTSREGGQRLRKEAKESLNRLRQKLKKVKSNENDAQPGLNPALQRLFSARHEFQKEWYAFVQTKSNEKAEMPLNITSEHFPFLFRGKNKDIHKINIFLKAKNDESLEGIELIKLEIAPPEAFDFEPLPLVWPFTDNDKLLKAFKEPPHPNEPWGLGKWVIRRDIDLAGLYKTSVEDLLFVCTYTLNED